MEWLLHLGLFVGCCEWVLGSLGCLGVLGGFQGFEVVARVSGMVVRWSQVVVSIWGCC